MEMLKDGTIRGTPQEIMEYQRLQAEKAERKPFKSPYASIDTDWMRGQTTITSDPPGSIGSGSTMVKRCAGPCYCTGACQIGQVTTIGQSYAKAWSGTNP